MVECSELNYYCCSVVQTCPTLCHLMDWSMVRLPCPSLFLEVAQIPWAGDTTQSSHPLSSPSPPAFNLPNIMVFSNESALRIRWPKDSVIQSCPALCDSHRLQHTKLLCPSLMPGACSNSCPLSRWCHPTISSSTIPFSSCLQSFPASGSFPRSQFTSGGESIGVSVSGLVFPMNIQDWFPLGLTGLISL